MTGLSRHFRQLEILTIFPPAMSGLLGLLLFWQPMAHGAGTVTNCTSADLSTALSGGGLVTFNCDGTIYLTNTITITNDTTFDASGHAVIISGLSGTNATSAVRVLNLNTGVSFTLINLTIANGSSTNGGAIFINNGGNVTATNCVFSGNRAIGANGLAGANGKDHSDTGGNGDHGGDGGPALGGAIYNLGAVSLTNCAFTGNAATGGNGGDGGDGGNGDTQGGNGANGGDGGNGYGGAIYSLGTVFVTNCVFASNTVVGGNGGSGGTKGTGTFPGFDGSGGKGGAGSGAGLYCLSPSTIVNSTISDNVAQGGNSATAGQANNGTGFDGDNGGESLGGGICNLGTNTASNCTFFGNKVTGGAGGNGGDGGLQGGDGGNGGLGAGGGFYNSGSATLTNVTFSSGSATGGPKGLGGSGVFPGSDGSNGNRRGGNVKRDSGTFTLKNCIVANSVSGNNGHGTITDGGHNISSDGSLNFSATGSLNNTDPKLGSLANNGGFTLTVALLAGSPAIDKVNTNISECLPFDQRGVLRPFGLKCDIGAYEFFPTFSIQGRITEGTNGVNGISVSAETNGITVSVETFSDTNGNYLINNLVSNNYTVTPQPVGVGFNPTNRTVTLGPSATNINFALNPVHITAIVPTTNGLFQLSFLAGPSRTYRIEASTNLTVWQSVSTNTSQSNGVFQFIDGNASNFPIRFYRTVTP